jgi:GNAT superfamily N-acetyltransferase
MTKATALHITRRLLLDATLAEQIRPIYLTSFPPEERDDFDDIVAGIHAGHLWLFTAERAGRLAGFAITMPLAGTDVHLFDYLAVAEESRSDGVGSALIQTIVDTLRADGGTSGLLLEVESDEADLPIDRALRQRRLRFYERHGASVIEAALSYRAPNLAGPGSVPMKLLWLPLSGTAGAPAGQALWDLIVRVYEQGYGRPFDDPLLQEVLSGLVC